MEELKFLDIRKIIEAAGRYIDNDMEPDERGNFEKAMIVEPRINDVYVRLYKQKMILKRLMRETKS